MLVVEEGRTESGWRVLLALAGSAACSAQLLRVSIADQRVIKSSGLSAATLPVPGLHAGLHIQAARLPEVALQREGRVPGRDQFRIVLDHHDVGVQVSLPQSLALVQLEVHLQGASSLVCRGLHKARRRLLVEAATRIHDASEGLLRLQHHVHGVGATLEVHLLNALVAALDLKGVRKVLFPDFCKQSKQIAWVTFKKNVGTVSDELLNAF